jgi:hypothetical protein
MRVAVVGGTGTFGVRAVAEFLDRGHEVRILPRHAPAGESAGFHRHVDLASGEGLPDALSGVEVVVDASNATRPGAMTKVLVRGTEHLLRAEAEVGVRHHVVLSIVGIDRVPCECVPVHVIGRREGSHLRGNRIRPLLAIETGIAGRRSRALKSRGVKFETGVLEYPWGCSRILTATGCSCGTAGGR